MIFFNCFMAFVGIVCDLTIIFWVACKVKPSMLDNERIEAIYDFIVGYDPDTDEVYETE